MTSNLILWTAFIVVQLALHAESFEMNMTKYYLMPSMYYFDDYDRCLGEFDDLSTYCFVRAEVLPQTESEAWRAINDISKYYKHHFDHRHLYFGLCVDWCQNSLSSLNETELSSLFSGILSNNSKVNTYLQLFSSEDPNRKSYNHMMNQCINLRLKKSYGLAANSVIEYCNTNVDTIENDYWNLTFYYILCALIFLVSMSSFYDYFLKNKVKNKVLSDPDHYKSNLNTLRDKILVTFSITRNWYRLCQEPNGKYGRDLRFLDCFKFFAMFLVIYAHTVWVLYESAISNPQDSEHLMHTPTGTVLVSGGLITTTFFVISGFLLVITWNTVKTERTNLSSSDYIKLFVKFNIFRYIRLTIPYAVVILISGVYFNNLGGPLWRHIVEREVLACRKNWWTNILYLNNYINTNERCMLQGWYLASDTQSFLLSLIIIFIADRWPSISTKLFGFIIASSFIIPGVLTYIYQYSPIFIASPQAQRDSFIDDKDFNEFYVPFEMIFGSYFSGVIAAKVYDHLSSKQKKLKQYIAFHVVWYLTIIAGVVWLLSAHPFLQIYFDEPPLIWNSLYAALNRNLWAFGLGFFIIGMTVKVGWIFTEFASLPIFRYLGRLTYGAFVIHVLVARTVIASIRQPIYLSPNIMFAFVLFTLVTSYICSFVLAILVELPVSAFLKLAR